MSLRVRRFFFVLAVLTLLVSNSFAQILGQQSLSMSSYVIDEQGKLFSFGANSDGQLGIGNTTDQNAPVQVPWPSGVDRWVLIAGGARHAMAVGDSNKLYAWGYNGDGELGNGGSTSVSAPVRVTNPSGVVKWIAISAGADHSVALASNGMLYAWGANDRGQLGTGDYTPTNSPKIVPLPSGVSGWSSVAAGAKVTIAISTDGRLFRWGSDTTGYFGMQRQYSSPEEYLPSMRFVSASYLPVVAISGKMASVLRSDYSRLSGDPSTVLNELIASVAVGLYHELHLMWTGSLESTGDNTYGQLGRGTSQSPILPMPIGATQWVSIAAGVRHSLAIANDGKLYAWGDNSHGQLGDGSAQNQNLPVPVKTVSGPAALTASITAPKAYAGQPFNVTVTTHNTNNTASFYAPFAALSAASPLHNITLAKQELFPFTIFPLESASAVWSVTADSNVPFADSAHVMAYVKATGAAPLLVTASVWVPKHTSNSAFSGLVVDSVTNQPIANADVWLRYSLDGVNTTSYVSTGANGRYDLPTTGSFYVTAAAENHLSKTTGFYVTNATDSIPILRLESSPVIASARHNIDLFVSPETMMFPDSVIGYGSGRSYLERSDDNGRNWTLANSPSSANATYFTSIREGWIAGNALSLYHTSDAGEHWDSLSVSTSAAAFNSLAASGKTLWAVGDSGYMVLTSGSYPIRPLRTLTQNSLHSVSLMDDSNGVAAGDGGTYIVLATSGVHAYSVSEDLLCASIIAPGHYWLGGRHGALLDDRGSHLQPRDTSAVFSIDFVNSRIGVAVGEDSLALITYDGGETWTRISNVGSSDLTSVDFFQHLGHIAALSHVIDYTFHPGPAYAMIRGRITESDTAHGKGGAIVRLKNATFGTTVDSQYSDAKGNFVFTPRQGTFAVELTLHDSAGTYAFSSDQIAAAASGEYVVNFVHPAAPLTRMSEAPTDRLEVLATPNPATDQVSIRFTTDAPDHANLTLLDPLGRSLKTVLSTTCRGENILQLDVRDLPQGVYLYKLMVKGIARSGSIVISR